MGTARGVFGVILALACAAGAREAPAASAGRFFVVQPCRLVDTRNPAGPWGGPSLAAGATRSFPVAGQCNLPPSAKVISANVAVTGATASGHLAILPAGIPNPGVSTVNFSVGQTRSNNVIVALGTGGGIDAFFGQTAGTVDLILDVNGYWDDPANNQPPFVTAGPDQSLILPAQATLNGTVWDDGKPTGSLSLQWSTVTGPAVVTFSAPTAATTTATFPFAGVYVLRLTASDGALTGTGDVTIAVDIASDAFRFLNQATWGPNDALVTELMTKSYVQWIDEQIATPSSGWPSLTLQPTTPPTGCGSGTACFRDNYTMYQLQATFFRKALYAPDQLRQRMVWALHKILVVSGQTLTQPSWVTPYLQILDRNAFGSYRQLLSEITLNPGMGRYLDMVTSTATRPNENYAREVNQLFSIGTVLLNPDGTPQIDTNPSSPYYGGPIPTYDQGVVDGFTKVFTGWTFAPQPSPGVLNYTSPMVVQTVSQHDSGEKQLYYPQIIPAGLTPQQDLDLALNAIISHPNVGPFISKALIQAFVTSNPSPAYVGRIAAVFNDDGTGAKGNLGAVVKAILLDPEARGGATGRAADGQLVDPVLLATRLLRALNAESYSLAGPSDGVLNPQIVLMGQDVFRPDTVFSYYPADYTLPGATDYAAPEFGLMGAQSALRRSNFVNTMVFLGIPVNTSVTNYVPAGTALDFSVFAPWAGDASALVDRINRLMMGRAMSAAMKAEIVNAVNAIPPANAAARVKQAIYLVATSAQYQAQR